MSESTSGVATSFDPVPILYTNWRGETAVRRIVPGPLWFGSTEWHPEPGWLLTADEPDTGKRRDFALSGIRAWGLAAIEDYRASLADRLPSGDAARSFGDIMRDLEDLERAAPSPAPPRNLEALQPGGDR